MPDTTKLLDDAVEKLKKAQKEQFENVEKQIADKIEKGEAFSELAEKSNKISKEVADTVDQVKSLAEKLAEEKAALNERLDEFESKFGPGGSKAARTKSVGAEFLETAFKEEADHAKAFERQKVDPVSFKDGAQHFLRKNISTAEGSAEALGDSLRLPGVITQPEDNLVVQTAIPRTFTQSRTIDYVRESGFTDNTATVAESTGTGDLVTKPQGNIIFEIITEAMTTIAQWIPASRQVLHFSNRTQLQSYIERRLRQKVLLELEDQVLLGDGTGTNMTGLITEATAYNRGYANIGGSAPTALDTIRRGLTQLQLVNYGADRVVLNPADWEEIALLKDSNLRYIFVDPAMATAPRVWGIPVTPSNRMTENKFLLGALATVTELFIGMDLTVEISREHASFFIQNMVAILAEMFALLAIYRPEGIIYGGLTNAES